MKKLLLIFSSLAIIFGGIAFSGEKASALSGNEPTYTYWLQSSSSYVKQTYGSWVDRTAYTHGPGTKNYSYSTTTSYSVTSSAELSNGTIKSALSSTFTESKTVNESLSCPIKGYEKVAYQTRDVYKHYDVKLQQWISIDGRKSKTGKTKVVSIKHKKGFEDRCNYKPI